MSEAVATHDKTPWNPSRRAMARVKDGTDVPTCCPFCQGEVEIQHHRQVYGGRSYGDWPWMYVCTTCGARVGMHPFTSIPLGTLADGPLRTARNNCKPAFEALWRDGSMTRGDAYAWLATALGIPAAQCHWGLFDLDLCHRAEAACLAFEGANHHGK